MGEPLPWEPEQGVREPVGVIFKSMEDGYSNTIKPRLIRLGADCNRVHVINYGVQPLTLDDPRVERAIIKTGAKLVIFDPLTAYCNGFYGVPAQSQIAWGEEERRNAADARCQAGEAECSPRRRSGGIRPILTRLADVAAQTNCAVVCICHLNKSGGKSQYRTLGSIDIFAIARSVLTMGKLPDDKEIRCFVHGKSNLTAPENHKKRV